MIHGNKTCSNNISADLRACTKMYPNPDSLTKICKCGNNNCRTGQFCFNRSSDKNGNDAGSLCLDTVVGTAEATMGSTGVCSSVNETTY